MLGCEVASKLDLVDLVLPIILAGREDEGLRFGVADPVESSLVLRPKKDSNPPPAFFFVSGVGNVSCLSLSTIRQPGGSKSSWPISCLDLTDISHAVEPFEAIYMAIGLDSVIGRCLVSRNASFMCLAVNVLANCTFGDKTRPSGTNISTAGTLEKRGLSAANGKQNRWDLQARNV